MKLSAPHTFKGWSLLALCFLILSQIAPTINSAVLMPAFNKTYVEYRAVQDVSFVMMGDRRMGGDLSFIQFLQYISSSDGEILDSGHQPDKPYENAMRVITIDPYFRYGTLFTSGLMAFHYKNYDLALKIVQQGMKVDPKYWRYRQYAAAISYKDANQTEKVIQLLEEAIKDPEVPTMIKNILSNFHYERGNILRTVELLEDIVANSRDQFYVNKARIKLSEIELRYHQYFHSH